MPLKIKQRNLTENEQTKQNNPDRPKIFHISSLVTSLGCQQGTEHREGSHTGYSSYLAGEGRGQGSFH